MNAETKYWTSLEEKSEFTVPYASDGAGNYFTPNKAEKKKDYYCNCGSVVRLRGGEKVRDHFYHLSESECSRESWLHKECKSVLLEEKCIYWVPEDKILNFDKVLLEKKRGDFIIDAIGIIGDSEYWIEFAVTHRCELKKEKWIQENYKRCIEINLSNKILLYRENVKRAINSSDNQEVIYDPKSLEIEIDYLRKSLSKYKELSEEYKRDLDNLESYHIRNDIRGIRSEIKEGNDILYDYVKTMIKNVSGPTIDRINGKSMYLKESKKGEHYFHNKNLGLLMFRDREKKNKWNFVIEG